MRNPERKSFLEQKLEAGLNIVRPFVQTMRENSKTILECVGIIVATPLLLLAEGEIFHDQESIKFIPKALAAGGVGVLIAIPAAILTRRQTNKEINKGANLAGTGGFEL